MHKKYPGCLFFIFFHIPRSCITTVYNIYNTVYSSSINTNIFCQTQKRVLNSDELTRDSALFFRPLPLLYFLLLTHFSQLSHTRIHKHVRARAWALALWSARCPRTNRLCVNDSFERANRFARSDNGFVFTSHIPSRSPVWERYREAVPTPARA